MSLLKVTAEAGADTGARLLHEPPTTIDVVSHTPIAVKTCFLRTLRHAGIPTAGTQPSPRAMMGSPPQRPRKDTHDERRDQGDARASRRRGAPRGAVSGDRPRLRTAGTNRGRSRARHIRHVAARDLSR